VKYTPARAIAALHAQHDMLRGMMDRCESLADELDSGRSGPVQLTREIARLRLAFEAHNRFEEDMLRPVLLAGTSAETMERLIDEHVDAHRQMRTGLVATETALLREVIVSMRAHLEAEERFMLGAQNLRAVSASSQ